MERPENYQTFQIYLLVTDTKYASRTGYTHMIKYGFNCAKFSNQNCKFITTQWRR